MNVEIKVVALLVIVAIASCLGTYAIVANQGLRRYVRKMQFICKTRKWNGTPLRDEANAWYTAPAPILWAYAGGGSLHKYGNSQEAIDESIKNGFRVIEIDVSLTSDRVPVLTHWFKPDDQIEWDSTPTLAEFKGRLINERFHSLTLKEFFDRYENSDVYFSIDPNHMVAKRMDFDLLGYIRDNASEGFQRRIIYQVYRLDDLLKVHEAGLPFASIHYVLSFGLDDSWAIPYLIRVFTECGVRSVSFSDRPITKELKEVVRAFNDANIRISVSGVDYKYRVEKLMGIGVRCFNTRRLLPNMFN